MDNKRKLTIDQISYCEVKNAKNISERGLSFSRIVDFDFNTAQIYIDDRIEYGETRYVAVGYLDQRVHVVCFTVSDLGIRVISFRKANAREVRNYAKIQ